MEEPRLASTRQTFAFPWAVAGGYAVLGGLWILLSDSVLSALVSDPGMVERLSIAKGWLFIAATALALLFLLRRRQVGYKQTERALRESEERYRLLVDLSPEAIIIHHQGAILYCNEMAAKAMRAGGAESLVGLPVMDFVLPEFHEELGRRMALLAAGPCSMPAIRLRYRAMDGTIMDGDSTAASLMLGGKLCVQVVVRDVTERNAEMNRLRLLSRVVEQVGEGVCVIDNDRRVAFVNRAWAQMHGYEAAELTGRPASMFISERTRATIIPRLEADVRSQGSTFTEIEHVRRDGSLFFADATLSALADESGKFIGRIAVARDITARKEGERLLRESEAKFRVLAESSAAAIGIFQSNRLIYMNPATERLLGCSREEIEGLGYWEMVFPEDREAVQREAMELLDGTRPSLGAEFRIKHGDGTLHWIAMSAGATEIEGKPTAVTMAFDVTERHHAAERMEQLAHYDFLTGLPNRLLFHELLGDRLSRTKASGASTALLFLDLDRFKDVNDTLGHDVGDLVLQSVARRLAPFTGPSGIVARTGSDEFAIVLDGIKGVEQVEATAQGVMEELSRPFTVSGHELHLTPSVGISLFPSDGADGESLLRQADMAMYRSKSQGGNAYNFSVPGLSAQALEQSALMARLRKAIEREEFKLYYQPILDMEGRRLIAMEALVRWDHPDLGLVLPLRFIPLAEETGLIQPLGQWILRAACAQAKMWQSAGYPAVPLSVNLSARQFQRKDLSGFVRSILADTGLDANRLELEITESVAMADMDNTISVLRELSALGITLTIDDFGTGYSSLSYLKKFPIQRLKIDSSFVRDVHRDSDDAAIVQAVVTMGHGLDLQVVAEGVENVGQLNFLKQTGCDGIQGFYFHHPAPAETWPPAFWK